VTTPGDLTQRLRGLSSEQLSVSPGQLVPDASLLDDLGVDSLAAIEWGMSIEDVFGISLPENSWERVVTYGMVEELVVGLAADPSGSAGTGARASSTASRS
jgi:acyl carrier protein